VLHDFVLLQDLIEDVQRPTAIDHEIFRNYFEPINDGLARENVVVVRGAQSDADAEVRKSIEAIRRHSNLREAKTGKGQ
jgi:hypothetical protein